MVNVTPDSFSDGGLTAGAESAVAHARALVGAGADFLDIGGESTRPGADPVTAEEEMARVLPVIEAVRGLGVPISIDTRNAETARRALAAGATILNDISAMTHDSESMGVAATAEGVCMMHAQGDPKTMQDDPAL